MPNGGDLSGRCCGIETRYLYVLHLCGEVAIHKMREEGEVDNLPGDHVAGAGDHRNEPSIKTEIIMPEIKPKVRTIFFIERLQERGKRSQDTRFEFRNASSFRVILQNQATFNLLGDKLRQ